MSGIEWSTVLIGIGFILVLWQLTTIGARLTQLFVILKSIDCEVFHLAQEQNPNYGACDSCGRRGAPCLNSIASRSSSFILGSGWE